MSTAETTLLTPDDLLALPEDGHVYELVGGELLEKPMSGETGWIAAEISGILRDHVRAADLGYLFAADTGYQGFPTPGKVRKPDASFIKKDRMPGGPPSRGHISIAPDLAVEVISPGDLARDLDDRIEDFREAGTPLLWEVNPGRRTVTVHRLPEHRSEILFGQEQLTGEDVLPGFRCRVSDFFLLPADGEAR